MGGKLLLKQAQGGGGAGVTEGTRPPWAVRCSSSGQKSGRSTSGKMKSDRKDFQKIHEYTYGRTNLYIRLFILR